MTEPVILSVDLGTSGMKVALINIHGETIGWDAEPVQLILTSDGGAEQTPEDWWQAFLTASIRLLSRHPQISSKVLAICCSTQGEGTIPVDHDGKALMNCILWMDMRGADSLHKQFKGLLNINGADFRKVLQWINLTGGMPSMTGKDPAAHMLFIRDRFPEIYDRTYKFLNVVDYLNLRLTGRYTATFDSILTSWVTDNRDPDNIHYSETLVGQSGIDRDKFPEIVPCTAILGNLQSKIADELGLLHNVKVVAGAIDNTAASIGAGSVEDFDTHIYIGTSSWMSAHTPFKKTDIGSSLASVPCAVPGKYLMTALQATAGGNLTFLRDNIIYHKDELLQEAEVPDIFKVLDEITARVPAGANGLIYTPWIWGERAPVEDRSLRAGLFNLSLNSNREDIIRSFLEGIAYNTRWLLSPVEKFLGRKVEVINIVGGGAQSDVWCQIFADIMGVEIRQPTDPLYANARGAAWIGAVGMKEITFSDIPQLVKFKNVYLPNKNLKAIYDDRFEIFTRIYKRMKCVYHKINT